jgi:hypothetical protein
MHAGRWFVAAVLVTALAAAIYADSVSSPSVGRVVWKADAELPADREWASSRAEAARSSACQSSAPPDLTSPRIRRSSRLVAQGRHSYEITAEARDSCAGERAELGQGNPTRVGFADRLFQQGDERYISFQLLLAPNFDVNVDTWRVITQLHQAGDLGTPALSLNVEGGRFVLFKSDAHLSSDDTAELRSAPAVKGRWVKFTLHVMFSPDPGVGFVELWGNPAGGPLVSLLKQTPTYTMKRDPSGATVPDHARIGIYRNPDGGFGTETVYYDGYTVATTRGAAEANAFSGSQ